MKQISGMELTMERGATVGDMIRRLKVERDALRAREKELVEALDDLMGVAIRAPSCTEPHCRICPKNRTIMTKARAALSKVRGA